VAVNWSLVTQKHAELEKLLLNPSLDAQRRQEMQKEYARLSGLLQFYTALQELQTQKEEALKQAHNSADPEMAALYAEEIPAIEQAIVNKQSELDSLLYPPDPLDDRSVFLEIRAGTGGQEAALFASDLLKMYTLYAQNQGWHVSLADESFTDLGGIREAVLHIEGKGVYGKLRYEAGVHRVQRVPRTETAGRVHTSTATVAVLPEAEEVDVQINPSDLRVDTYRASGAGGQHVNKTDSAVRITHIPTGIVVACQEERSQHKNRAKAMKMLQSRMLAAQQEKQQAEMSQKRKEMVGTGMRAEKVRTYNFPQNRITDHQVELTLKKLDMVMAGDLDEIIEALVAKGRADRRSSLDEAQI
jgi:peptide chain release factor 1